MILASTAIEKLADADMNIDNELDQQVRQGCGLQKGAGPVSGALSLTDQMPSLDRAQQLSRQCTTLGTTARNPLRFFRSR